MCSKLTRGLIHIGQIGMSIAAPCRRADSYEYGVGCHDSRPDISREMQTSCINITRHQFLKSRLINRHETRPDVGNLSRILVDAGHIKAEFRETGSRNKTDIAGSNDCQLQGCLLIV